ncbi:hypothetical protein BBD40_12900 [Paenibacillus ihbetae]|uniref:Uncharacterized protein n=1 Tax=Paenibacillus ihbetae TaxID=1870820 RepID=A0ABX3JZR4_9BACL|nr:hypothetical protein BBD40_12900 [Paenibacillus ihbetae]
MNICIIRERHSVPAIFDDNPAARLIEMIPANLKHAIRVGIGLFIAFIGMRMSGIITAQPDDPVALCK